MLILTWRHADPASGHQNLLNVDPFARDHPAFRWAGHACRVRFLRLARPRPDFLPTATPVGLTVLGRPALPLSWPAHDGTLLGDARTED